MPIVYDIYTDALYIKGFEDGFKKYIEEAMEKEKIEVIRNARHEGMSVEVIARIVKLLPERVREILDELGIE